MGGVSRISGAIWSAAMTSACRPAIVMLARFVLAMRMVFSARHPPVQQTPTVRLERFVLRTRHVAGATGGEEAFTAWHRMRPACAIAIVRKIQIQTGIHRQ